MKTALPSSTYAFTPGAAGAGTLVFSLANFDPRRLLAVINLDRSDVVIYAPTATAGYTSASGGTVTLGVNTTGHNAADKLLVLYDDPAADVRENYDDGSGNPVRVTPATPLPTAGAICGAVVTQSVASGTNATPGTPPAGCTAYHVFVTGGSDLTIEISSDNSNWYPAAVVVLDAINAKAGSLIGGYGGVPYTNVGGTSGSGSLVVFTGGLYLRIRGVSAGTYRFTPLAGLTPFVQAVGLAGTPGVRIVGNTPGDVYTEINYASVAGSPAAVNVESGHRTLAGVRVTNLATSARWLKIFNVYASGVVMGTTAPRFNFAVPAGFSDWVLPFGFGLTFLFGCSFAVTGGPTPTDTTAVGANEVFVTTFSHSGLS